MVAGWDLRELLLYQLQGAEVEALHLGAAFHVAALDDATEPGDEGLGIDGVVGGRFCVAGARQSG